MKDNCFLTGENGSDFMRGLGAGQVLLNLLDTSADSGDKLILYI
jgi:hypothetical protein